MPTLKESAIGTFAIGAAIAYIAGFSLHQRTQIKLMHIGDKLSSYVERVDGEVGFSRNDRLDFARRAKLSEEETLAIIRFDYPFGSNIRSGRVGTYEQLENALNSYRDGESK